MNPTKGSVTAIRKIATKSIITTLKMKTETQLVEIPYPDQRSVLYIIYYSQQMT